MARGGGRRNYVRDASGRFSSTPGGGNKSLAAARKKSTPAAKKVKDPAQPKGGTLAARSSLKRSMAKLMGAGKPSSAQKGAVTRGSKALKAAKEASKKRMAPMKNVIGKPKGLKRSELASGITPSKTAPKRKRLATAKVGTVAKPKDLRPGDLAKRREARAQAAKMATAKPVKRNRFLDPIARQILIATGQIQRTKGK
jgi:hypothetical protein